MRVQSLSTTCHTCFLALRSTLMRRATSGVALIALTTLTGCATTSEATSSPSDIVVTPAPSPPAADVTTINGKVPPGEPTAVVQSLTLLDVVEGDLQHLVYRDTRQPGTRSPIHQHPYGGSTCVLSGQMTLFVQGGEPKVADEGECYWMPPGVSMTGSATGNDYAVMIDTFAVPPGQPVWWVVEPGQEGTVDEFGGGDQGHM